MTNKILTLVTFLLIVLTSCKKDGADGSSMSSLYSASSASGEGNSGNQNQPGVITAGEWNDLEHWSFWDSTISTNNFRTMPGYWSFFNNNRIAVKLVGANSLPVVNALLKLKKNGTTIFSARTDNLGNAELWADIFQHSTTFDFSTLTIDINNGSNIFSNVKAYQQGINEFVVSPATVDNKIEISFVVDATGSMGDELNYLKTELLNVISRVKDSNLNSTISTSSVFYRDEGDDYVTKVSNFTNNNTITANFIKDQNAGGGGDFPEAVHWGLDKAVNELQWSANAKTRLLFLLLDAPPHHENDVINSIQTSVQKAAEKGIKIIPITASGINKPTESLMRFLSISTNGTYVFITNHSGIGNDHLEATVGAYQVEFLNNLMVRLINKYAQ